MSGPFKVGDVVVCVDAPPTTNYGSWLPKRGAIYSISATCIGNVTGKACVRLAQDPEPKPDADGDWYARRFQLLPKADEQFTAQMRAIKPVRKSVSA